MEYFDKDVFGHYRPMFVSDCDVWDEMFKELIGDENESLEEKVRKVRRASKPT